jgi:hypothetical protein
MQHQHIIGPAFGKHLFDMRQDDMRGLVAHHLHSEVADLRVTEHPPERLGVRRRGQQVPQSLMLVLVISDDQGFPLAAHPPRSPAACRLTNNSISRA